MSVQKFEKIISTLIAVCAVGGLLFLLWSAHEAVGNFTDFPEYYAAAKFILIGKGASSYVVSEIAKSQHDFFPYLGTRFIPIYLPPPGLILFTPIGLFGLPLAFYLWKILSLSCLVVSVYLLVRTFSLTYKNTCYLIAGLSLAHATFEVLRIDQIAAMLLLSFTAALYFLQRNKDNAAGLALASMIVKPQLVLPFLFYLIGLRRWRPIIIFGVVAILLTALSYLILGEAGYSNYLALLRAPESAQYMQPEVMPTVRGQLLRLCPGFSREIFYLSAVIFLAMTASSWFCGDDNRKSNKGVLWAVLVTMPLTLITSLHCHSYDLLLLVPTMVVIFTDAVLVFNWRFKLMIIIAGAVFMVPMAIFIHYFYLLKGGPLNIWFIELLMLELAISMRLIFRKEIA